MVKKKKFLILLSTRRAFLSRGSSEWRWPLSCSLHLHGVISCHLKVNTAKRQPKEDFVGAFKEMIASYKKEICCAGCEADGQPCLWPQGVTDHRQGRNRVSQWVSLNPTELKVPLCHPLSGLKGCIILRELCYPGLQLSMESWKKSPQTKNHQEAI